MTLSCIGPLLGHDIGIYWTSISNNIENCDVDLYSKITQFIDQEWSRHQEVLNNLKQSSKYNKQKEQTYSKLQVSVLWQQ